MNKIYKFTLIIFFIIILKILIPQDAQAVGFNFFDANKNPISSLELDINETKKIYAAINYNEYAVVVGLYAPTIESGNKDLATGSLGYYGTDLYPDNKFADYEGRAEFTITSKGKEGTCDIKVSVSSYTNLGIVKVTNHTATKTLKVTVTDKGRAAYIASLDKYKTMGLQDIKVDGAFPRVASAEWLYKHMNGETTAGEETELVKGLKAGEDPIKDARDLKQTLENLLNINGKWPDSAKHWEDHPYRETVITKKNMDNWIDMLDDLIEEFEKSKAAGATTPKDIVDNSNANAIVNAAKQRTIKFQGFSSAFQYETDEGRGVIWDTDYDAVENTDNFQPVISVSDPDKYEGKLSKILTAITNLGMVLSVVILAILGIKFMIGSIEEKAEFKKDLVPYFTGVCLLFGITLFVKMFIAIGEKINTI